MREDRTRFILVATVMIGVLVTLAACTSEPPSPTPTHTPTPVLSGELSGIIITGRCTICDLVPIGGFVRLYYKPKSSKSGSTVIATGDFGGEVFDVGDTIQVIETDEEIQTVPVPNSHRRMPVPFMIHYDPAMIDLDGDYSIKVQFGPDWFYEPPPTLAPGEEWVWVHRSATIYENEDRLKVLTKGHPYRNLVVVVDQRDIME